MIQLRQLIPTNLAAEKAKFFANRSYSPQFVYPGPVNEAELEYYGKPEKKLVQLAQFILKTHAPLHLLRLTSRERETQLSDDAVQIQTTKYLRMIGLQERFGIHFKPDTVARCSITTDSITFRAGADYTENTLSATLNHELGTHALRRINDETQPWHGQKKKNGLENGLVTEEGLAVLHQQLDQRIPSLYNSAVLYVANDFARSHSFSELWDFLTLFIRNEEKRWTMCFRAKRGFTDTSTKGSYSKDLVYFKGAYEVSEWLAEHNFDLGRLYYGKISYKDVEKIESLKTNKDLVLPPFFTQSKIQYADKITRIREINSFV